MTYSAGLGEVVPPMVSALSLGWSLYAHERVMQSDPASASFESANRAIYHPILVPTTCVAKRLWWANGASGSASYNIDVGIYLDAGYKPGTKLISTGSTAQGTASEVQFVDITDTTLAPGRYWLAVAVSDTGSTLFRSGLPSVGDAAFRFDEASALPLPATATPAESSSTLAWLCGFATTASP